MPSFEFYEVDPVTGCHNWTHKLSARGYAYNFYGPVARQVWQSKFGVLDKSLVIDHLCRNPACINTDHLEPVTQAENVRRGDVWKIHGLKTHCPRGHEYNEQNTRVYNGRRHCRACDNLRGGNKKRRRLSEIDRDGA